MQRAAPWLARSGALLILLAPFLPQAEAGGVRAGSWSVTRDLAPKVPGPERLAVAAGLFVPVLAGAVMLAGAGLPGGGPAALRLAALALVLALSFLLSTLGSILLTDGVARPVSPSFPLLIALFAVPLVLSGVAVSRWMQGGLARSTGAFERLALSLLLLLHGLFLADSGWGTLLEAQGIPNGTLRLLPGAAAGPLGAAACAAAALLPPAAPRAAVDSAPASG
jgi:hypothetical protein